MAQAAGIAHIALEVHLPQVIGMGVLKARERRLAGIGAKAQPAVAAQDLVNGAGCRHLVHARILEQPRQLARAPIGVGFA